MRYSQRHTVGIRELKNNLSAYLRRVRAGESVRVTDRGEIVAELNPPGRGVQDQSIAPGLAELARRGLATLGSGSSPELYIGKRLRRQTRDRTTSQELLDEERGQR